jgi:hypothetical protein
MPQPVFGLQVTVPPKPKAGDARSEDVLKPDFLLAPPLSAAPTPGGPWRTIIPYSPLIVAVNVTAWPKPDGFVPDITDVLDVACVMLKLFICELLEPV